MSHPKKEDNHNEGILFRYRPHLVNTMYNRILQLVNTIHNVTPNLEKNNHITIYNYNYYAFEKNNKHCQ